VIDVEEFIALHRPRWMNHPGRHCATIDTAVFFDGTSKALGICLGCPVQAECLTWALDNNERGTWGGTSERSRKKMRRKMKAHESNTR
jgi:hypothetical protein